MNDHSYVYLGEVTRVVDGDTIDAKLSLGFRMTTIQRFRLASVNCPETFGQESKWGLACKARVQSVVDAHHSVIKVRTYKSDSFGRWLADVSFRTEANQDLSWEDCASPYNLDLVSDILIREGWGVTWDGKGKNPKPWSSWGRYPNPPHTDGS